MRLRKPVLRHAADSSPAQAIGQRGKRPRPPEEAMVQTNAPGETAGKPLIESDRVEETVVYDVNGHEIGSIKRLMIEKVSGRVACRDGLRRLPRRR